MQTDTAPNWFSVEGGKVYVRCPSCHSQNVSYHKERTPGLTGISRLSQGLKPACLDCGKNMPQLGPKPVKQRGPKIVRVRTF